jgi:spore germination cell wall hydrolase CwlJ-like protein
MGWVFATAAPWALAGGLLVSFTAAARNDPQTGFSAASLALVGAPKLTAPLVPASTGSLPGLTRAASLRMDLPAEALVDPISDPIRGEFKPGPRAFPAVARELKGDPLVALRPSLSRSGLDLAPGASTSRLVFGRDPRLLPPTILLPGALHAPSSSIDMAFEPWEADETVVTEPTTSARSPSGGASGVTGGAAAAVTPSAEGRTPSVPRALALSSSTPQDMNALPVQIAAAPVSRPAFSIAPDASLAARIEPGGKPRYADLVAADALPREQRCLAEVVYFEARSEPAEGQAAVAQVVLNRVRSGLYPASICGVVYQNRHRHLACQFTFACEGKALRITEGESWRQAVQVADAVLNGKTYLADVGSSTHYHADYVRPNWARKLKKMDVIGRHIFYKLRPGQT